MMDAPTVMEEELQQTTIKAINQIVQCSEFMMKVLKVNIEEALVDDNSVETEELNAIVVEKQKELVKLPHAKKAMDHIAYEISIF